MKRSLCLCSKTELNIKSTEKINRVEIAKTNIKGLYLVFGYVLTIKRYVNKKIKKRAILKPIGLNRRAKKKRKTNNNPK